MGRKKHLKVSHNIDKISIKDAANSKCKTDAFKLMMDSRPKKKDSYSPPEDITESQIIERHVLNENENFSSNKIDKERCMYDQIEKKVQKKESIKIKLINKKEIKGKMLTEVNRKKSVLIKNEIKNSQITPLKSIVYEEVLKAVVVEKATVSNIVDTQFKDESQQSEQSLANVVSVDKKENMICYLERMFNNSNTLIHDKSTLEFNGYCNNVDSKEIKDLKDHEKKGSGNDKSKTNLCIPPIFEKRKRSLKRANSDIDFVVSDKKETERPKRNVKKPLKYTEDMCSSDDNEILVTRKKRKQAEKKFKQNHTQIHSPPLENYLKVELVKQNVEVKTQYKKATKLAPLFKLKLQLTPEEISAKQQFLHSGFPEQLKKNNMPLLVKNDSEIQEILPVVHIQQNNNMPFNEVVEKLVDSFNYSETEGNEDLSGPTDFLKIICSQVNTKVNNDFLVNITNPRKLLQEIKAAHPEIPVFRIYNRLKSRRRESGNLIDQSICSETSKDPALPCVKISSKCLAWTDKYKATSTSNYIGNIEVVKEMKKWLANWIENDMKGKIYASNSSDTSDFIDSDTAYTNVTKLLNNLVILSGPTGSGKTSSVYAVASELAIKVIEVNVSSKRTGKSIVQDLREATQSHKINRRTIFEKSKKQQGLVKPNKKLNTKERKKHSFKNLKVISEERDIKDLEKENSQACMSLILIDDADIVFEEDDGFSSAITQLVYSSKRPVVFTTSSTDCPHMQRFLQHSKLLHMKPFLSKKIGTWLDILCVVDTGQCWPGLGSKILNNFKGDIRKTMNFLQFYMTAQKQLRLEHLAQTNDEVDRFDSTEDPTEQRSIDFEALSSTWVKNNQSYLEQVHLFTLWWNIPKYILQKLNTDMISNSNRSKEVKTISSLMDTISVCDFLSYDIHLSSKPCLMSEPWKVFEIDFVSELQNQAMYNGNRERIDTIVQDLVTKSIMECQKSLSVEENICTVSPEMTVQQQKEKLVSRHTNLNNLVNPSNALDRRALALDYWPACRTLCRIEESKAKKVFKRHNRYCHYLKSLSGSYNNDHLDRLGESLSCTQIFKD